MNVAAPFITRPVMTTLVTLSILLAGAIGYTQLPVSDLPNVDFPTIQVSASLPGANPDTMASSVALPLEKEFSTIAGVDSMSSSSAQGSTQITLQFVLDRNIDAAAQDVQAAISRAARRLPDMPIPPYYRKVNPADQPILYLTLTSTIMPMYDVDDVAQTMMAQRISMVDGVAQVQVYGAQKYAVRIQIDPQALASRGLGIDEVASAVNQNNVNMPLGQLSGSNKVASIQSNGQLTDASKYMPLIVSYRKGQAAGGQPVRLRDLGLVKDSVENDRIAAWFCNAQTVNRAIVLAIQKQPGTNTVKVAEAVKALLPTFRQKLPASLSLGILRDNSVSIMNSVNDVQFTLLLTLGLVVMVIFLFLRNATATLIPSLTLPMSIVGTFAVMALLGYSLDNLSLMALTLSVGFVVDDAIVMLENIVRHMEMGKSRLQAALDGSREVGFTIVSMTLSLAAVFIPVLFMSGIVGRLFREFSVTIGAAVLVSGVVSLTLTPMLSSRFLKNQHQIRHGAFYQASEAAFQWMVSIYGTALSFVLRHRRATMLFSLGILAATVVLFLQIRLDFLPSEDRDQISISTEAAQDSSFPGMVERQMALVDIVRKNPNVDSFMARAGGGGGLGSTNTGGMFVTLIPRKQRPDVSADAVIGQLRAATSKVPGIRVFLTNPPAINIGGRMAKSLYQLTLQGTDTDDLYAYASKLERQIKDLPNFQDVASDLQMKNPQLHVDVDHDKARVLGATPMQIQDALYTAYGTRQVSTIYAPNNQFQVIMELLPKYQADRRALSMLYVRSAEGILVPLSALTQISEDVGPLVINHSGQIPSVTISFNLKPGFSLGQAVEQIDGLTRGSIPAGITRSFQGTAQAFQSSLSSMGILLVLAVVVIYVVLGILYESFYHPITILSALPFAGFGALLTLMIFNCSLSVYAFVGIIMLVGLVKKNGIMMVDFALESQKAGKNAHDAIHEACMVRFRPIMMTTMAALMGGIPIAVGYGAGGEARQPLGLAVVGGLLFSQALTLFVTPVFFVYMEKLRTWIARRHTVAATLATPAPATVAAK